MTVNSRVIKTFLQWSPDAVDVPLLNGLRIQILPTVEDLPRARKHQFAAFVASEALLVVWDDDALHLVQRAKAIESELMELVWKTGEQEDDEKKEAGVTTYEIDEESGEFIPEKRGLHLQNTVLVALTLMLIMTTLGAGFRQIAIEVDVDGSYTRLALLALTPVQIFFTLFFGQVIIGCLAQLFGPVRQLTVNSKFYSARPPPRLQSATLPHITIQCPVYKEGLGSVIAPTVKSIKQAISTYELQGGSANMFINDDGLQIIDEDERRARIEFYADHSIGWVARPKHGDNFTRKGKCEYLYIYSRPSADNCHSQESKPPKYPPIICGTSGDQCSSRKIFDPYNSSSRFRRFLRLHFRAHGFGWSSMACRSLQWPPRATLHYVKHLLTISLLDRLPT